MLSGSPPFQPTLNDPLALIHKHIAVQPTPLHELSEVHVCYFTSLISIINTFIINIVLIIYVDYTSIIKCSAKIIM